MVERGETGASLDSAVLDFCRYYDCSKSLLRQSCADTSDVSDELINSFKLPGGADNVSKYKSGEVSAQKLAVEVASDLKADIAIDVVASAFAAAPIPQIKGLGILGKAALSLPRYYAKSKAAINSLSLLSKTMQEAERVISSRQGGNSGGPNLEPEDPEDGKKRVRAEKTDADNYIKGLRDKGVLSDSGITKDGHKYFRVEQKCEYKGVQFKKGDYLSLDTQHWEWELFRGPKNHQGAIDSIKGVLNELKRDSARILRLP